MLLLAALAVVGAARLRRRAPDEALAYRASGWPVTPAAYVLVSAAVITGALYNALSAGEWVPVLGLLAFFAMLGVGRVLNRAG
jgi:hypothetical protein